MAEPEKVTATGKSGKKYEFSVYPWGTTFKALGGVYLVLKKKQTGGYDVLYVGQTGDLSERFDDHHKQGCFNRNGKTHIAVKVESVEKTRLAIERDLSDNYNPTCNG